MAGWQEGHPVCKNWVVRYWHGYLSGARCKWFTCAQLMPLPPNISCSSKIQNGALFWCQLTQVVLEKRPLNGLVVVILDSDHFSIFQVLQVFWNQKYEKLRQYHTWKRKSLSFKITPFPSNRQHRNNGDCLEGKRQNYQVCSVQYCVQQLYTVNCTHIWTDLTVLWIGFCLIGPVSLCLDSFLWMY